MARIPAAPGPGFGVLGRRLAPVTVQRGAGSARLLCRRRAAGAQRIHVEIGVARTDALQGSRGLGEDRGCILLGIATSLRGFLAGTIRGLLRATDRQLELLSAASQALVLCPGGVEDLLRVGTQ